MDQNFQPSSPNPTEPANTNINPTPDITFSPNVSQSAVGNEVFTPSVINPTATNPTPMSSIQPSPIVPSPTQPTAPVATTNSFMDQPAQVSGGSFGPAGGDGITPPVSGGDFLGSNSQNQKPKKQRGKLKVILLASLLVLLIGGGVSAGYFGYILPNSPKNVWSKAMVNTGKAYDKLVDYSTDLQKETKGIKVTGSFKAEGEFNGSGTLDSSSLNADSYSKAGVKLKQGDLKLETRSISVKGSEFPDYYFMVSGIGKVFGKEAASTPIVKAVDGQWISVTHDYLEDLYKNTSGNTDGQISSQDVIELEKAVSNASKQWVFTDNTNKQVIQVKKVIGKESLDKRTVYHYQAEINKNNLKSYLKALGEEVSKTKLGKNFKVSDDIINKTVDNMEMPSIFDAWVDTRTKLVHKLKIGDDKSYTEFSQDFQGGSKVPFGIKAYDNSGSGEVTFTTTGTLDMDANKLDLNFKLDSKNQKIDGQLSIAQNNEQPKVEKPSKSTPIQEVLNLIFGGFALPNSSSSASSPTIQNKARDTERQTDIQALASHLEVYNAQNGYYPTLANLNDKDWVAANMKGLDNEARKDPTSGSYAIVTTPVKNYYAYSVTTTSGGKCSGTTCKKFVLTATLSTGKTYTVKSLSGNGLSL